jgi:hypothetical protein
MGTTLTTGAIPVLAADETTPGLKTLYLTIDLGNGASKTTAVYIPNAFAPESPVNMLIYFHGHKGMLGNVSLKGMSIQQYLKVKEFKLREFVKAASAQNFVLVVPTLGDTSGAGLLTGSAANFDAYLDQILAGIAEYQLKPRGKPVLDHIILSAHSGGGAAMLSIANNSLSSSSPTFNKIREIWCFDCTYGGGSAWLKWVESPAHTLDRMWLYSTGSWNKPDGGRTGTGDDTKVLSDFATKKKRSNIEVSIPSSGVRVNWNYPTGQFGHNECVGTFMTLLIDSSNNLGF